MRQKFNNKVLTDKLVTMLSKPVAYTKTCEVCGKNFTVNTNDSIVSKCLVCAVKHDMKLSDDVLINQNIVNLWKSKRYSETKGIDSMLCAVAEGIILMPEEPKRDHLTHFIVKLNKITNDKIENYLIENIKKSLGVYDAILILRFNPKDDFSIFKIRLSVRLAKKLQNKSPLSIKKFLISLAIKYSLKSLKDKRKR